MRKGREKRLLLSGTMILLFPFIALGEKKVINRKLGKKRKQTENNYEKRHQLEARLKMNEVNIDAT